MPAVFLTASCSRLIPINCTGISQPPKLVKRALSSCATENRGVRVRDTISSGLATSCFAVVDELLYLILLTRDRHFFTKHYNINPMPPLKKAWGKLI